MTKVKFTIQGEKPIGLCNDHAGYEMKTFILHFLEENGIPFVDYGCYSSERADYPDFAHKMATAIEASEIELGIAICGSGNGINITMNKHQAIRSALCWNVEIAELARLHNNANVLALPGRMVSNEDGLAMVVKFFNTAFEGGRHQDRVDKIPCR